MPPNKYSYRYSWDSSADWDTALAQDDVEHEPDGGAGIGQGAVQLGQPFDHLTDSSDEAYYKIVTPNVSGLNDVSPANNNGLLQNVTKAGLPDRKFTGALVFNGTNSLAACFQPLWQTGTLVAFEAWVRPEQGGEGAHVIMDKGGMWSLRWDNDTPQGFDVSTAGAESGPIGPSGLAYNQWHHVNCYWDAGSDEIGMSVNGSVWETVAVSDAMTNRNASVGFGNYVGGSANHFKGQLTEMRCVSGQRIELNESLYITSGSLTTAQKP